MMARSKNVQNSCKFIWLFLAFAQHWTWASDLERENRLNDEVLAALFTGEPVWLDSGATEFLALDTLVDTEKTKGGVILLHGRGLNPDSETVVGPLRASLAEHGWRTLSVQMPVLEKNAKYYEYVKIFPEATPRIDSAIQYYREQDISPIVLLAHSCGVHMSMAWIDRQGADAIDGFVGIGMGATDAGQPMRAPFPIEKIRAPILDVYGEFDHPSTFKNVPERTVQIQETRNTHSKQIQVDGADHDFTGMDDVLFSTISEWLDETLSK